MGVSVFRRVQEGHHGEPAITRERKHFSKIHESDCKPSTCLACSYLNWREEVSAALCSAVNRMNERHRNPSCRGLTTVCLRPRHKNHQHFYKVGCTTYLLAMTAASGESLLLSLECLQTTFSTVNIDRTPSYSIHCQLRGTQRFFPVLPFL